MPASPARRAAYRVLRRVNEQGAYADRALHGEARSLTDGRERGLARQLAYGTVQRRLTLDWAIDRLVERRIDPELRAALQLGLYQLLFLQGVAPHAAVSESVELVKGHRGSGLVNAVLRRAAREGVTLPDDADPAGAPIRHSHPEWLVRMWWDWLGPEATRALLAADNEPGELALRVNPLVEAGAVALGRAGGPAGDGTAGGPAGAAAGDGTAGRGIEIPGRPASWPPEARIVDGPLDAFAHPLYAAGAFTPQSRASMLAARAVDPQPGERILDLCAAPGGKTTHLAALMGGTGTVVAVERHAGRAKALRETSQRMGAANVDVLVQDARDPVPGAPFDRVLVDPPCSGLGTLRGHPDLRWRASPEGIAAMAAEQEALLTAAEAALTPGGRLVYSVCTLSPDEERMAGDGHLRTLPHRDDTDGFYIAWHGGGPGPDVPELL
jgi:16S rRNA (cytosine967-C5)-methyltransferase